MKSLAPPPSCRPEWVFEVSSRLHRLAGEPWARICLRLASILRDLPAESEFEAALVSDWLDRARLERLGEASGAAVDEPVQAETDPSTVSPNLDSRVHRPVATAKALMDRDYSVHWTIESVARRVGCNRTDLEAGFRLLVGQSVHSYLTVRRIEAAKQLLRTTPWRIEEVGKAVGYRSKVSFYFNFRNALGISPDEYRRRWIRCSPSRALAELLILNRH